MKKREITAEELFDESIWERMPYGESLERGYWPNGVFYLIGSKPSIIAVVAWKSEDGPDFSLNQAALMTALKNERKGLIAKAYIVLANTNQVFNTGTVNEVWTAIDDIDPIGGKDGPYWWMTDELRVRERRKKREKQHEWGEM